MKMIFTFFLCILICVFGLQAKKVTKDGKAKGTGKISGTIIDSLTQTPMAYTTVSIIEKKSQQIIDGAISNAKGDFVVDGLAIDDYDVKFSFMGYQTKIISGIKLTKDNPSNNLSTIQLSAKSLELGEVEVSANKSNITYKLDKKILNISENPNIQGGKLADALQNFPSITLDNEGKVTLRGSSNFQVLIDGRPSQMNGNEALKLIPVEVVENIELITNPSAKYDPDGSVGIINVVTKKMDMNGINGMINSSVGIKDKYSIDGLFNYKFSDFNFYTGINYSSMIFRPSSDFVRETYNTNYDSTFYINPVIDRSVQDKGLTGKAGIEYNIDKTRFLTISGFINKVDYQRLMPSKIKIWTNPLSSEQFVLNEDSYSIKGYYSTINGFYLKNFATKGHQISSTINAIIWDGEGIEDSRNSKTDNNYFITDTNSQRHFSQADSRSFMLKAKIDYVCPINKNLVFEAGYNYDYTQDFSDFLYQDFNSNTKIWEKNLIYSNNTKYFHTINALYSTLSSELFGLSYQFGIRAEYFNRRLEQDTEQNDFIYEKINIFPTIHISKNFENDHHLQLSYSRRVQRPDVYALNPFPDYADDYYVSVGNPNLMPEFTDSYEFNYQKGFDDLFFSIQTYYRNTNNAISRVLRVKEDNKVWITSENIARQYVLGAEFAINYNITKSFRINMNANIFANSLESNDNSIQEDVNGNSFNATMMMFYNVTQTTLVQLNLFYLGPQYTIDGKVEDTYSVGFSAKQFLFNKKVTLYLSARNILNTMKYQVSNKRITYSNYGTNFTEGANVSLGVSVNINNYERKLRPEDQIEKTNVGASGGY